MSNLSDVFGASPKTVLNKPYMHVQWRLVEDAQDDVASGENVAKMNNVKHNDITGATLGSNKVTLPAGSYYVEYVDAMYEGVNDHSAQARIKAGTTEVLRGVGSRNVLTTAVGVGTVVAVGGQFTITESTDISFILYSSVASLNGKTQVGSGDEVFAEARIWKLDSNIETPVVSDPTMTLMRPLLHVQDQKASGTTGGTSTTSSYHDRDLNTVLTNEIVGASLSSDEVTLPAGTYYLEATAPAIRSNGAFLSVAKSDNTQLLRGTYAFTDEASSTGGGNTATVNGRIVLTATTTIKLRHWIKAGYSNSGLGAAASAGDNEVFTDLRIWQQDAVRQIEAISDPNMTLKRPLLQVIAETASAIGANAWKDIPLDAVIINEISGASLNSNEITLPAGEYEVSGEAAHRSSSSDGTYIPLQASIRTSGDTVLISGLAVSGRNDREGVVVPIFGRFTLASTTTLKLSVYNDGIAISEAESESARLHFADLRIYQLDAVTTTPVLVNDKLYPLPGNTIVTGNMHGLEISRTGTHTVSVSPGICMDSTNKEVLSISSTSSVTIGSTVNELYNLFICKTSGGVVSIQTDTDVNGVNLTSYQYIRWIGFVRNNSAGSLIEFSQSGDRITHHSVSENILATLTETATVYDHSALMPESRIKGIYYGVKAGNTLDEVYLGYGGQAWDILIGKGINPIALSFLWGTELHRDELAFDPDNYYFFNDWQQTGTAEVLTVRSVTIKR